MGISLFFPNNLAYAMDGEAPTVLEDIDALMNSKQQFKAKKIPPSIGSSRAVGLQYEKKKSLVNMIEEQAVTINLFNSSLCNSTN